MTIQSVSNVSFGAKTKNGNEYKKTHTATIIGTAAGLAAGTSYMYGMKKMVQKNPIAQQMMKDTIYKVVKDLAKSVSEEKAIKITKNIFKGVIGFYILLPTLIGLGIGAIVNKNKNRHRAEIADLKKAADKTTQTQKN